MRKLNHCSMICLLLVLGTSGFALGIQSPEDEGKTREIYKIDWRELGEMGELITGVVGRRDVRISYNGPLRLLTVEASPEDHRLIRSLLDQYDVPRKTVELRIYIVKATTSESPLKDGVPDEIRRLLDEVGALTRYRGFEVLDAPIVRGLEGEGVALTGAAGVEYSIELAPATIVEGTPAKIQINPFSVSYQIVEGVQMAEPVLARKENEQGKPESLTYVVQPIRRTAGVQTSFTIADGGSVVVGASRLDQASGATDGEDIALITVVQAFIRNPNSP